MDDSEEDGDRDEHHIRENFYSGHGFQVLGVVNDFDDGLHTASFHPYQRAIPVPMPGNRRETLLISFCSMEFRSLPQDGSMANPFPTNSNSWGKSGKTFPPFTSAQRSLSGHFRW